MLKPEILERVSTYYSEKLRTHGPSPKGVDWNSAESQGLRFLQLLRIHHGDEPFSVNDYGCGYGALIDHLRAQGASFSYCGFDVSPSMITVARERHAAMRDCVFVTTETALPVADYTLASGIFNVKLDIPEEDWRGYMLDTLHRIDAVSRRGFAFNVLTSYSDADKRRPDLYYADPSFLFDYCKTRFSPAVALLHDYPLFEFTMLVRKAAQ